jgi:hypothetical protein
MLQLFQQGDSVICVENRQFPGTNRADLLPLVEGKKYIVSHPCILYTRDCIGRVNHISIQVSGVPEWAFSQMIFLPEEAYWEMKSLIKNELDKQAK